MKIINGTYGDEKIACITTTQNELASVQVATDILEELWNKLQNQPPICNTIIDEVAHTMHYSIVDENDSIDMKCYKLLNTIYDIVSFLVGLEEVLEYGNYTVKNFTIKENEGD